jgi:hypothetical protein
MCGTDVAAAQLLIVCALFVLAAALQHHTIIQLHMSSMLQQCDDINTRHWQFHEAAPADSNVSPQLLQLGSILTKRHVDKTCSRTVTVNTPLTACDAGSKILCYNKGARSEKT